MDFVGTVWALLPPVIAIVLVMFIVGGAIWLNIRNRKKK